MHLQQEPQETHSIQICTPTKIQIQDKTYTKSLLVSRGQLDATWPVHNFNDLTKEILDRILLLKPEIIIIGHLKPQLQPPELWLPTLSQQRIGFECMGFTAACRTFNVLLSEYRSVVLGLIII